jgi:hypothetical protein
MKYFVLTLAVSLIASSSYGQTTFKRNDIYLQAGGNGLLVSMNYERQLTEEPGFGLRLGLGFHPGEGYNLIVPVGVNYLFEIKNDKSFVEAGLGVTWTRTPVILLANSKGIEGNSFISFVPSVGYRQHTNRNMMWRINLTPIINKYSAFPWFGLSLGKRF